VDFAAEGSDADRSYDVPHPVSEAAIAIANAPLPKTESLALIILSSSELLSRADLRLPLTPAVVPHPATVEEVPDQVETVQT